MSKENQTPDYGFTRGLPYTSTRYDNEGPAETQEGVIDPREFPMPSTHPEHVARVHEEMRTRNIARVAGRSVEYARVGSGPHLKLIFYGWGGNPGAVAAQNEAAALSLQTDPDTTLLFVGNPGAGQSDTLPRAAQRHVAKTGSFVPYGEHIAGALSGIVNVYDSVSIGGHSLGGRIGIGMVATGQAVDSLIAIDPPGSRTLGLRGIAEGFMSREGAHTAQYLEHSLDPASRDIQRENDSLPNVATSLWRVALNGGLIPQFVREPLAMSREALAADLEQAAPNVLRHLEIVSPDLSELNTTEDLARIVGGIAGHTEAEVWLRKLPGHTHSVLTAHPGVPAWLYTQR